MCADYRIKLIKLKLERFDCYLELFLKLFNQTVSLEQPTKTATDTTPHQTILPLHS